jgi:uncharacterized protein (TIGR00730 family)
MRKNGLPLRTSQKKSFLTLFALAPLKTRILIKIPHFSPIIKAMKHMKSPLTSICVYCGSGPGTDPAFVECAEIFGRIMAENNVRLVYGGGSRGLMGTVARSVLDHGGYVTGIIPEFLKAREAMLEEAQDMIVVPDMHSRKKLMFEQADAFVALPGGVGTLEELVEQLTWSQLERHNKPILMLSIKQFWKPLLVLFAHMREFGFIRPGLELSYMVAEKTEDALPMLQKALERPALHALNSAHAVNSSASLGLTGRFET